MLCIIIDAMKRIVLLKLRWKEELYYYYYYRCNENNEHVQMSRKN